MGLDRRLELQGILEEALGSDHVYFQPPSNTDLIYPCIVYNRTPGRSIKADNTNYFYTQQYDAIVISRDPDNDIAVRILDLIPASRISRSYINDNLNHDVVSLFY